MPKNFLESDDELDVWSSTSSTSSGRKSVSPTDLQFRKGPFDRKDDFSIFQDYFGLSNLLQNVKISDDNPLLFENRRNLAPFNKTKRLSWESDGSDPNVVISPIGQSMSFTYGTNGDFPSSDGYQRPQMPSAEPTYKNLPPPSMRLSKAARDQIISGAYQNQLNRSRSEKLPSPPPPPQSHVQLPVGNVSTVRPQATVQVCVFCRNNGELEAVYSSHVLKDAEGRTSCPILRAYTCPICKANGDNSHTIKYCPLNQQQNGQARLQQQNTSFKGNRGLRPPPLSMNGRVIKPHWNLEPLTWAFICWMLITIAQHVRQVISKILNYSIGSFEIN